MTKFVVGAITLSLGAFIVGGDLLGSGPRLFWQRPNGRCEIGGEHQITIDEYNSALQNKKITTSSTSVASLANAKDRRCSLRPGNS